ncbi:hypothetical protein [Rheinheimera salexigens]|uniref:DnaT DNA-binding domain-containing protein n=1 Tax=Rheinheimera salexigens TaxID=1628148 RepID=A0A1E7Q842_9GAMM|nr:hypothetical protein [Rheinheimera salexigens]OEY70355.1 hypothetical protein BI198_12810 [Rheinheimera salexigens]
MARARNIKPAFFLNDDLVELSFEYRLLFIGLWTLSDREGRLEDRPKRIRMGVFPADNVDVDHGLSELERFGFIQRYEINGERLVQILNFTKHQNPHHTEKASELPDINGVYPSSKDKQAAKTKTETVKQQQDNGNRKDSNGALTVNPPCKDGEYLADSLIPDSLIPDSLIPEEEISTAVAGASKLERAKAAKDLDYSNWPAKPSDQVFKDYLTFRKAKKSPMTQTVVNRLAKQLSLAVDAGFTVDDCLGEAMMKGWAGFEYEWLINARASPSKQKLPHSFEKQNYTSGAL